MPRWITGPLAHPSFTLPSQAPHPSCREHVRVHVHAHLLHAYQLLIAVLVGADGVDNPGLHNGIPDPNFAPVIGTGRWTSYSFEGTNTWVLYAIDSAGNISSPSNSVTLDGSSGDCQ
ncbi:MAG: hypothetical protein ACRDNP_14450 [Gaiellaceae bacterium]